MTIQSVRLRGRFSVPNIEYAETMARCVQAFTHQKGYPLRDHRVKHVVAIMYGYRNWKHLIDNIVGESVGPLSRDLSAIQVQARNAHCLQVMLRAGVPVSVGEPLLHVVAPMDTATPVRALFWSQDSQGVWNTCSEPDFSFSVEKIGTRGSGAAQRYRATSIGEGASGVDAAFEGDCVQTVRAQVDAAWKARIVHYEKSSLAA